LCFIFLCLCLTQDWLDVRKENISFRRVFFSRTIQRLIIHIFFVQVVSRLAGPSGHTV
jgi:hypothetical protein